jgi:hypothetical protein
MRRTMRLGFLLLLPLPMMAGACSHAVDTPPDPSLRDVRISYVHATPEWIMERGYAMHLARSAHDQTLAFSQLTRVTKTCIVTLPYEGMVGPNLYWRLKTHEERHCHGEQHRATTFRGEPPFD